MRRAAPPTRRFAGRAVGSPPAGPPPAPAGAPTREERRNICARCPHWAPPDVCARLADAAAYQTALTRARADLCPLQKWTARWRPPADPAPVVGSPLLVATVAVGPTFARLLDVSRPLLRAYAARCRADYLEITDATQTWAPLEKFRLLPHARAHARTLYIDADVLVRPTAPNLFALYPRGLVLHDDFPHLPCQRWPAGERRGMLAAQGVLPAPRDAHRLLNSGVVLCDAATADIWSPPPRPFLPTHCAEQFWVESLTRGRPTTTLPTRYNTQYWMSDFYQRLPAAQLIHLAFCPPAQRLDLFRSLAAWCVHGDYP